MHLQITNKLTLALDAFRFSFESAGALELPNEYSGLASEAAPILPWQSSGMHVPSHQLAQWRRMMNQLTDTVYTAYVGIDWEQRGPPDFCDKVGGDWVCE